MLSSISTSRDKWFGEYEAVALGVSASTVEELAWRIMSGRERLDVGPKVRRAGLGPVHRGGKGGAPAGSAWMHCHSPA